MSENLRRFTLPEGRVYTDGDVFFPSVTTVLDQMPEPKALYYWKKKYDGKDGMEHWRDDILAYKGPRGTMIHYHLLNEFADDDMFGQNEEDATEQLKLEGNWDRFQKDLIYAREAWQDIKRIRGIDDDAVLDVECFVTNHGVGYAGQFDLLYVDKDSNIVLSDIKTSSGVRDKHQMQLTAYDHAIELPVDILEVIRIHPDSETWEVSHHTDWDVDTDDLWKKFRKLREGMTNVEAKFKRIAEEGIEDG